MMNLSYCHMALAYMVALLVQKARLSVVAPEPACTLLKELFSALMAGSKNTLLQLSDRMNVDTQAQSGLSAAAIGRPENFGSENMPFKWTWSKVGQSILLFVLAAAAEVGGGWLIWQAIRADRPWWWGLLGSVVLSVYGFVPTLQPVAHFARTFAVYGGFFIVYSYAWGWALDNEHPDTGDFVGAGVALFGVCVCWFWPRKVRTD